MNKNERQKYNKSDIPNLRAVAESCMEKMKYYERKYKELLTLIKELEKEEMK